MSFFSDIKLFMKYADVEFRHSPGNKLFQAVENNDLEDVKSILAPYQQDLSFDWSDAIIKKDMLLLFVAIKNRNVEIVKELIKSNIPVKTRDVENFSALEYAIRYNQFEILKLLLENGAKTNVRYGNEGKTPIFLSIEALVSKKSLEIVKLLVQYGAKINIRDEDGFTPLQKAIKKGRLDIVEFLVEKGADVNQRVGPKEISIFEKAIKDRTKFGILEYLLISGADPFIKNINNKSAYDIAKESNNETLINIIEKSIKNE